MSTIRSSREIDHVFKTARRSAHPLVIALVAQTPSGRDQSGRVAFVAGKKLGKAVLRNRGKRVLRAAAQLAGQPWPGSDVVLIARPATVGANSREVAAAVREVLHRAGIDS